jgi:hypothetical protein
MHKGPVFSFDLSGVSARPRCGHNGLHFIRDAERFRRSGYIFFRLEVFFAVFFDAFAVFLDFFAFLAMFPSLIAIEHSICMLKTTP